ncbi:MAG: class IV adenylate cyclase [Candidatus Saccharimonadota bacterium]
MKNEIEAKFVNINIDDIRSRLTELGAILIQPMRDMQRVTIDTPELKKKDAFVRIRNEGDKTTITYKQFNSLSIDGVKEVEITVDDFDTAVTLFKEAGLAYGSLQESRRETWKLDEVEIVIDEWPWLNPYIEIEAPSEDLVILTSEKLGFNWDDAIFGDVMAAYRVQYPHLGLNDTVGNLPEVRFSDPVPNLLKS